MRNIEAMLHPQPLAYGHNQGCTLSNGSDHSGLIISMGNEGARLRLAAPVVQALRLGEACVLQSGVCMNGADLAPCLCRVEWLSGDEVGVTFHTSCDVSVLALQQAIARGLLGQKEML